MPCENMALKGSDEAARSARKAGSSRPSLQMTVTSEAARPPGSECDDASSASVRTPLKRSTLLMLRSWRSWGSLGRRHSTYIHNIEGHMCLVARVRVSSESARTLLQHSLQRDDI
jgi:hypothetical protein